MDSDTAEMEETNLDEDMRIRDSLVNSVFEIPLGSGVMFFSPEGLFYGALQSYDGRVSPAGNDYYDDEMLGRECILKPLSLRDRTVRLEDIFPL